MFDYLIVGSGLFGSIFAYEASKKKLKCLVIEKRSHIGGNCYTENIQEINVHKYGAHIFRTSDEKIWKYMQNFCEFNHFINSPIANYKGSIYNLPFNMNTFYQLWGVKTPQEAQKIIQEQSAFIKDEPKNLEEQAISLVGVDIYKTLIKGYTEKQWGRECSQLPVSIIKRIPVRYIYDNNYFRDPYQGIPKGGYTLIFEKMLKECEVIKNVDFIQNRREFANKAKKIIFTGPIDSYYDYKFGALEYRSLDFKHKVLNQENFQGVAVVNYTDKEVPYTRTIEHKHFEFLQSPTTVVSEEYPLEWNLKVEPYYPINDKKNQSLYNEYYALSKKEKNVYFGGRLGEYRYYDMQDVVKSALEFCKKELGD